MLDRQGHYTRESLSLFNFETTKGQRRTAVLVMLFILLVSVCTLPFARQSFIELRAFLPGFIAAVIVMELVTSYLLYSQFRETRSPEIVVLAGTYLFSSLVTIPHLLTFPDVFSASGLLGAGTQTSVWFWAFWHGGFPLGVLLYVLTRRLTGGGGVLSAERMRRWAVRVPLIVLGLVVLLGVLATVFHDWLPVLIEKNNFTRLLTSGAGPVVWLLNTAALVCMWRGTRLRTPLHLWLAVAVLASLLDVTMTLFSGSRYSIGWYVARINSLFSSGLVLIALVYEINRLYYNLASSEQRYASLFKNNSDAVFSLNLQGRLVTANPASEVMTGYSRDELIDRPFVELLVEEDIELVRGYFQGTIQGDSQHHEMRLKHRDGHIVHMQVTSVPIIVEGRIVGAYGIGKDITERKRAENTINHMAYHDALTGLSNRRLFKDRLQLAITEAEQRGTGLAVMFLDLDRFKVINDTLGHDVGDLLLKEVSERLSRSLHSDEMVARMGGDEFTVLLPEDSDGESAKELAKHIILALKEPLLLAGNEMHITTSIGIARYPEDGRDVDTLMKLADRAMYRAKALGKNRYQFYHEMINQQSQNRLSLENDLRKALEREEFHVYYQPQFHGSSRQIVGMEALVRWKHPQRGLVSPAEFIPLAEETGLIVPLGEWVLVTACRQNKAWQEAGFPPVRVAVNLSTAQFQQGGLVEMVANALQETGLDPQYLELEITESIAMENVDRVISTLAELKELGIEIAIDDFGTGYSSLIYLKNFPIQRLKIDQSFVRDLTFDSNDAAIVRTIIAMAHSLKLSVIAEGVETEEQLRFLADQSCHEMQGYLFSPPVPAERLEQLLTGQGLA